MRSGASPAGFLRALFDEAVAACAANRVVPPALPNPPRGRTVVLGAGKAAAAMAAAVERHWRRDLQGLVVVPFGHGVPTERIEVVEASHPLPGAAGLAAAGRILVMADDLGRDDLGLCLISGGGSALLSAPVEGVTLVEKVQLTAGLLGSGVPIGEINTVRKCLSAIKGGQLARRCHPARVVTLAVSDVAGDDPATIASGPTVFDRPRPAEALALIERYGLDVPPAILSHLRTAAAQGEVDDFDGFDRDDFRIVANARTALAAAAASAKAEGLAVIVDEIVEGKARKAAGDLAARALDIRREARSFSLPCLLLSGGETTVRVRGRGRGGRNTEFALALAAALGRESGIWALAADTDGIDGSGDNAGAVIGPDTLDRASAAGLDVAARLADNDAYAVFAALGDLITTGPTRTNVNDFRAILIEG